MGNTGFWHSAPSAASLWLSMRLSLLTFALVVHPTVLFEMCCQSLALQRLDDVVAVVALDVESLSEHDSFKYSRFACGGGRREHAWVDHRAMRAYQE